MPNKAEIWRTMTGPVSAVEGAAIREEDPAPHITHCRKVAAPFTNDLEAFETLLTELATRTRRITELRSRYQTQLNNLKKAQAATTRLKLDAELEANQQAYKAVFKAVGAA